jgi:hypothetical protein
MKKFYFLASVSTALLTGCGSKDSAPSAPTTPPPAPAPKAEAAPAQPTGGSVLTAPVDYLATAANAKKTADAKIEIATLAQQIQLHFAQEGRFPKDLNELVTSKYMKNLPTPPFGFKFAYDAAKGEVKLVNQ